jgi:hypothetical protein
VLLPAHEDIEIFDFTDDVTKKYLCRLDARWSGLRNSLSGLFCASLSGMDARRTTSPTHTFVPGPLPMLPMLGATNDANATSTRYHLRHAALPGEGVCTENLTPFTKLLPCAARSGLGGLLAPHKLFDADWHGMGVHVTWDPEIGVKVRLSFRAVFDPTRNGAGKRGQFVVIAVLSCAIVIRMHVFVLPFHLIPSCPALASCFVSLLSLFFCLFFFNFSTLLHLKHADPPGFLSVSPPIHIDWSLTTLFGRPISQACPVASSSSVSVLLAQHSSIIPPFQSVSEDGYAFWSLGSGECLVSFIRFLVSWFLICWSIRYDGVVVFHLGGGEGGGNELGFGFGGWHKSSHAVRRARSIPCPKTNLRSWNTCRFRS